jgi:hypothetical protein
VLAEHQTPPQLQHMNRDARYAADGLLDQMRDLLTWDADTGIITIDGQPVADSTIYDGLQQLTDSVMPRNINAAAQAILDTLVKNKLPNTYIRNKTLKRRHAELQIAKSPGPPAFSVRKYKEHK